MLSNTALGEDFPFFVCEWIEVSPKHSLVLTPKILNVIECLLFESICLFTGGASGKEHACQDRRPKRLGFSPCVRKILWKREWQPTPVFLPGESHGQRSLAGYSPRGCKESDMTELLTPATCLEEEIVPLASSSSVFPGNEWSTRSLFCLPLSGKVLTW